MTIEQRIETDLAPVGVPVFQQGDWTGDVALPSEFVTYYPVASVDVEHFDNLPTAYETQMQVNVYCDDPDRLAVLRSAVMRALLSSRWTRDGRGYGGELDDATGRFPWFMVFYLYEKESE